MKTDENPPNLRNIQRKRLKSKSNEINRALNYISVENISLKARLLRAAGYAVATVDHNILLRKLFHYGIRDNNLKLLQSYLQNRKQYVSYQNTEKIEYKNVICGVPQGSILGPLLFFSIYKRYLVFNTFIRSYYVCR